MSDRSTRTRHAIRYALAAGVAALPYGFAASGLALGAGALLVDSPLIGACGAVAGVTGGLLATSRTRLYHRQAVALRERLRKQRATADGAASGLRSRISALEVTVWERQVLAAPPEPVVEPVVTEPAQPEPVVAEPAEVEPVAVAEPVAEAEPAPSIRPGIRLAYAAAQITVPRTVLAAAVATTGSLSLADIAAAAERKAAEREQTAEQPDTEAELDEATTAA